MHVAHVAGALKGGPLSAVADLIRFQAAAGYQISLIYSPLRDSLSTLKDAIPPQVMLYPLNITRDIHLISDYRACRDLVSILKQTRPDVLHLHSSKAGAIGRIAAKLAKVPTIYSTHAIAFLRTDVGILARSSFFLLEWLLGLIGTITVACSASELKAMRAIPGRKIFIPNGIDLETIPAAIHRAPQPGLRIVTCGRITAQKNPELAVRIAQMLPPDWQWIWIGSGELSDTVEKSGRIEVSGWMPRGAVLAALGSSDVMVHTSSWEGMPIAILEGMAMELPVIATDVVGNRDLVLHGKTGFIADDAPSFFDALQTLAVSGKLRREMGIAGRERISADFNQTKLAVRWMELYSQLTQL